jgi:hypothetical protein
MPRAIVSNIITAIMRSADYQAVWMGVSFPTSEGPHRRLFVPGHFQDAMKAHWQFSVKDNVADGLALATNDRWRFSRQRDRRHGFTRFFQRSASLNRGNGHGNRWFSPPDRVTLDRVRSTTSVINPEIPRIFRGVRFERLCHPPRQEKVSADADTQMVGTSMWSVTAKPPSLRGDL